MRDSLVIILKSLRWFYYDVQAKTPHYYMKQNIESTKKTSTSDVKIKEMSHVNEMSDRKGYLTIDTITPLRSVSGKCTCPLYNYCWGPYLGCPPAPRKWLSWTSVIYTGHLYLQWQFSRSRQPNTNYNGE